MKFKNSVLSADAIVVDQMMNEIKNQLIPGPENSFTN